MKRILLLLCGLLSLSGVRAQLTLDQCRTLAREHYPEIRQYDLIQQTTGYTLSNARRSWLPQLSFSAQATWQNAVPDFPDQMKSIYSQMGIDMAGLQKDQYKLALELNQTLWDGGKSRADRQITEAEDVEQRHATNVDLYALEERVDDLYFSILLFDEHIAQTRQLLVLLQSNLDKVRALLKNGVAMQSDTDAVEAELLTARQQLILVEASRNSYRQMLGIFIGQELNATQLIRPDTAEPADMTPERPELALFDAKIGKLAAQESMVRSSTNPRFGIFAQGYYGYPGLNMFEDMLHSSWSWNALVGVKMQWNFGGYYTRRNSVNKLRIAQQQVEVQRDIFLFNNRLQTVQENGEILRLRKALADDDRIVALRRSVREAAESKLRNGVIDTNDLLGKITEENNARTARSAREIELLKTIYELKHTINR